MFTNIIIGVDGHSGGREAIVLAERLAVPGARLTLVHFYGEAWRLGRDAGREHDAHRAAAIEMLTEEREAAGVEADLLALSGGAVARGLHLLASRRGADLLVVGSSRRGFLGRLLAGDDAKAALLGAPCPVAIAPAGYAWAARLGQIGVGYDHSPEADQALNVARALARRNGGKVRAFALVSLQTVPHDVSFPSRWREVALTLVDDFQRELDSLIDIEGDADYGDPAKELTRVSDELDLLVVGSRSEGVMHQLVHGTTAGHLADHARCPLLVMPRSAGATVWSSPSSLAEPVGV